MMSMGLEYSPMAMNYLKKQANFVSAPNTSCHLWALIAFLTAAISFSWKIKSSYIQYSSSSSSSLLPPHHHHPSFKSSSSSSSDVDDIDQQQLPSSSTPPAASLTNTFCRLENRRSGKFSLHYGQTTTTTTHDDDDDDDIMIHNQQYSIIRSSHQQQQQLELQEEEEESMMMMMNTTSSSIYKHMGYWELADDVVLLKMKTIREMMGWYHHHQDLSLLHGNVVRFWTH